MAPHRNTPAASGVAVSGEPEGSLVNNGGAVFPLSSKFAPFVRVERCAPPAPLGGASGSVSSAAASAPAYSVAIHLQRRNLHDSDLQQFVGWFAACQQQLRQQSAPASLPPSAAAASPPPSAKAAAPPRAPPPRPVLFCSLDLSDNAITANGVWQLLRFFLVRCATVRLTKLKLYKNAIGNGGAVAVSMFIRSAAAKRCLALEELHLSHCCIGNTGCLYILEAVAAACPGASGVQTAHSAGVSGGEGSDSARQSGSSGSPCYPRFDGRRKLYIPLWIRLEYNVIKEPLGLVRGWSSSMRLRRNDGAAPLVCFADRQSQQQQHCTPARCWRACGSDAPLVHMYMFGHQHPVEGGRRASLDAAPSSGIKKTAASTGTASSANSDPAAALAGSSPPSSSTSNSNSNSNSNSSANSNARAKASAAAPPGWGSSGEGSSGGKSNSRSRGSPAVASSSTSAAPNGGSSTTTTTNHNHNHNNNNNSNNNNNNNNSNNAGIRATAVSASAKGSASSSSDKKGGAESASAAASSVQHGASTHPAASIEQQQQPHPPCAGLECGEQREEACAAETEKGRRVSSDLKEASAGAADGAETTGAASLGKRWSVSLFFDSSALQRLAREKCALHSAQEDASCSVGSLQGLRELCLEGLLGEGERGEAAASIVCLGGAAERDPATTRSQTPLNHALRSLAREFKCIRGIDSASSGALSATPHRRTSCVSEAPPVGGGGALNSSGYAALSAQEESIGKALQLSPETLRTLDAALVWRQEQALLSRGTPPCAGAGGGGDVFLVTADPAVKVFVHRVSSPDSAAAASALHAASASSALSLPAPRRPKAYLPCLMLEDLCSCFAAARAATRQMHQTSQQRRPTRMAAAEFAQILFAALDEQQQQLLLLGDQQRRRSLDGTGGDSSGDEESGSGVAADAAASAALSAEMPADGAGEGLLGSLLSGGAGSSASAFCQTNAASLEESLGQDPSPADSALRVDDFGRSDASVVLHLHHHDTQQEGGVPPRGGGFLAAAASSGGREELPPSLSSAEAFLDVTHSETAAAFVAAASAALQSQATNPGGGGGATSAAAAEFLFQNFLASAGKEAAAAAAAAVGGGGVCGGVGGGGPKEAAAPWSGAAASDSFSFEGGEASPAAGLAPAAADRGSRVCNPAAVSFPALLKRLPVDAVGTPDCAAAAQSQHASSASLHVQEQLLFHLEQQLFLPPPPPHGLSNGGATALDALQPITAGAAAAAASASDISEVKAELIDAISIVQELSNRLRLCEAAAASSSVGAVGGGGVGSSGGSAAGAGGAERSLTEDLLQRASQSVFRWRRLLLATRSQHPPQPRRSAASLFASPAAAHPIVDGASQQPALWGGGVGTAATPAGPSVSALSWANGEAASSAAAAHSSATRFSSPSQTEPTGGALPPLPWPPAPHPAAPADLSSVSVSGAAGCWSANPAGGGGASGGGALSSSAFVETPPLPPPPPAHPPDLRPPPQTSAAEQFLALHAQWNPSSNGNASNNNPTNNHPLHHANPAAPSPSQAPPPPLAERWRQSSIL